MMKVWLLASALMLFFEGFLLSVAPDKWKSIMVELVRLPTSQLRKIGLSLSVGAVVLLMLSWLAA
ncbi:MAG: DUF2065 domain-containing protein [Cardiobacteriaceae bacterium]|nr:DUF2065 domain-containing protein [Cardiobacteriaceae bacterium]